MATASRAKDRARAPDKAGAVILVAAALEAFGAQGYHGTSVRDIVRRADVTIAALYYHFETKHQILYHIMRGAMEELIRQTEEALAAAGDDPVAQLGAVVRAHAAYHTAHQSEAFVGNTELRSLQPEARAHIVALRDRQQAIFEQVIARGSRLGAFAPTDQKEAVRAILAMCTAIATWYQEGDGLTPDEIASRYVEIAARVVGGSNGAG
jgi:AcrR family transcriptional regulator